MSPYSRIIRAKISNSFQPTKQYNVIYYFTNRLVIIVVEIYYPIFLSNIFSNYFKEWSPSGIKTMANYNIDFFKWCSHTVTANSNRNIKINSLCTIDYSHSNFLVWNLWYNLSWILHLKTRNCCFFYKRSYNAV